MPRHSHEVAVLRRQNRWFINDNPATIQLIPHPQTRTPAGGRTRAPVTPRAPQKVRLVPLDRQRAAQTSIGTDQSAQKEVNFEVIGDIDLEIATGDKFLHGLVEYEVLEVQPLSSAPYLRRAFVYGNPADGAV